MKTPELETAINVLETSLRRAEREINEPVAYFPEAAIAIRIAAQKDSAELGHDLLAAQSLLGKVRVPPDGMDEIPRAQDFVDALRARIADAIKLAEDAGYQTREEQSGSPDRLEVKRITHAEQLDRLTNSIQELAKDIQSIREAQAADSTSNEQQKNLVQYFVERVEIKIALFELNLKEVVELLGLGEALAGLMRLIRSFVASVMPAGLRFSNWLKEKAARLKPIAGAIGEGFSQLVASVRKERKSRPLPDMTQEEAEAEARRLILEGKAVPDHIATHVRSLDFAGDNGLGSLRLFANLINLQYLNLAGTQVADLTPLAALTNLERLNLGGTQVAGVTPLAALTNLQSLYLSSTQVADVAPLAALTNLQTLDLRGTRVTDFSPVRHVPELQTDEKPPPPKPRKKRK